MKKAKKQKEEVGGRLRETRKDGGLQPLTAQKSSKPRLTTVPRDTDTTVPRDSS